MQSSLFEIESIADEFRRSGYAKRMASLARRPRAGSRSDTDAMEDAAMEKTGKLLRFSSEEQQLVGIIRDVRRIALTARQTEQGVEPPTSLSRRNSETLAIDLYESFDLVPERVAASVEGGILFAYKRSDGLRLEIEVDNDGDIVGVISTSKQVIRSEIIDLPAKLSQLVRDFKLSRIAPV